MNARDNILARIRRQQGRTGPTSAEEMEAVRANIRNHAAGPQPDAARAPDPVAQFKSECTRLLTTFAEVAEADVPGEVARYCDGANIAQRSLEATAASLRDRQGRPAEVPRTSASRKTVAGWSAYAHWNWSAARVEYESRAANGDDIVGFTGCFCAIAETGTLLLLSSSEQPKLNALLPETHICVVPKSRIVSTMEDAFALVRKEIGAPPRSMYFVSGPSRTADIEQTIVIGAHGPYRVHVILT